MKFNGIKDFSSFVEWLNQEMESDGLHFDEIEDTPGVMKCNDQRIGVCWYRGSYQVYSGDLPGDKDEAITYFLSLYKNPASKGKQYKDFYFGSYTKLKSELSTKGGDGVVLKENPNYRPMGIDKLKACLKKVIKYRELPHDFIISGPPGAGKSHFVENCVIPEIIDSTDIESHCERILFSDAVYHETFFGGYRPVMKDGNIAYAFVPGPFCRILKKAYQNRNENYVLVIEEFNRGDAYDILGEVFQLLDRGTNMESSYKVSLSDEAKEYFDDPKMDKIYLPDNLFIICTMNNADSGVRYIDTAMKRRFQMIYIDEDGNIYGAQKEKKDETTEKTVQSAIIPVDKDNIPEKKLQSKYDPIKKSDWDDWRKIINNVIREESTEDKLLSEHFIEYPEGAEDNEEVIDGDQFIIKVLGYLYQNVFRGNEEKMGEIIDFEDAPPSRSVIGLLKKYHSDDKRIAEILRV